jgi:quinol monooxygenase YgiN
MMSVFIFATLQWPENVAAVRDAMRGMQRDSLAEPGCQLYQVLQEADSAVMLHVFERYQDMAALEAHRASPHYQAYRSWVADKLAAPVQVKQLHALD